MGKIKRPRNYLIFRKPRNRAIRGLNNIYVLNELSCKALLSAKKQLEEDKKKKLNFEVPAVTGDIVTTVQRRIKIIHLLGEAIDTGFPRQFISGRKNFKRRWSIKLQTRRCSKRGKQKWGLLLTLIHLYQETRADLPR